MGDLGKSLTLSKMRSDAALDPLRFDHYFFTVTPKIHVSRLETDFQRILNIFKINLMSVDVEGLSVVHIKVNDLENLLSDGGLIRELSEIVDSFYTVPDYFRADMNWLDSLTTVNLVDIVLRFHPVLNHYEKERVLRSIMSLFEYSSFKEGFTNSGKDVNDKHWYGVRLTKKTILSIVKGYFCLSSVSSGLHSDSSFNCNKLIKLDNIYKEF